MRTLDYVPAAKRRTKKGAPRMIAFRLSPAKRARLEARMRADGIPSVQALCEAMVNRYLDERVKR